MVHTDTPKSAYSVVILVSVCALYVLVAYASPGYEDEFYNIPIVERATSFWAMIDQISREDVHPVGQYVINYLLFKCFNSWSIARVAGALASAFAVWSFVQSSDFEGTGKKTLALTLVALNPTLLLWCTGLRWLTYFVPLFLFTLIWLRRNISSPAAFWSVFTALLAGLFHINYITILLGPPILALAVYNRRESLSREAIVIAFTLGIGVLLCLPQFYFFFYYQRLNNSEQEGGIIQSMAGAAQGLLVNMGVFPLSMFGAASVILLFAVVIMIVRERGFSLIANKSVIFLGSAIVLMILSGVATKPRNLAPLVPVLMASLIVLASQLKAWRLAQGALLGVALINLVGIRNVVAHQDTAKGSWNLPVERVKTIVEQRAKSCRGRLIVAVNEPVLTYALEQARTSVVVSPYGGLSPAGAVAEPDDCLIALRSYRGSMSKDAYQRMLGDLPASPAEEILIDKDVYASIKSKFDPDIPEYYIRVLDFGIVGKKVVLNDWLPAANTEWLPPALARLAHTSLTTNSCEPAE